MQASNSMSGTVNYNKKKMQPIQKVNKKKYDILVESVFFFFFFFIKLG